MLAVKVRTNPRQVPLHALRAFEAAARLLSFKKAALELHVTPGAISHQVKALEEHVGAPLFRRLTRALELTPEGTAMLAPVQEGLANLASAIEQVAARQVHNALTVIAPPNFTSHWLLPRLGRFTAAYPDLELHLASRASMIDGRDEDLAASHGPDDTPLAMVRFGDGRYPGARVDEVFGATYVPVCSPKLLTGPHALRSPEDLRFHTLLHDETVTDEDARPSWADFLASAGVRDIDASRGPRFSDASLALEGAREGMGVVLAMKPLVRGEIEAGRLAIPFDLAAPAGYAYYLVTPEATASRRSIAAFREWLLRESEAERGASAEAD